MQIGNTCECCRAELGPAACRMTAETLDGGGWDAPSAPIVYLC